MSFSAEVKKELSLLNNLNNKEQVKAELSGYILGGNYTEQNGIGMLVTENQYNTNRLNKLLENVQMDFENIKKGKNILTKWKSEKRDVIVDIDIENDEVKKAVVRGAFLASGSLNEPNKKYHLELVFSTKENSKYIFYILENFDIECKIIKRKDKYCLYIKDGEEISKFLALIGAKKAVLNYEEIRIFREMRSNVNRIVNCETANINKTINVAISQIQDIKYLREKECFESLPGNLKEIAKIREANPESSLAELGKLLEIPIGKSGVNHRLKKIHEIAEELRENDK